MASIAKIAREESDKSLDSMLSEDEDVEEIKVDIESQVPNTKKRKEPGKKKNMWTAVEDAKLKKHVDDEGTKKWGKVGIPDRNAEMCRARWNQHLKPGLIKTPWTQEEEDVLVDLQNEHGNNITEITKITKNMSGRSIITWFSSEIGQGMHYT